MSIKIIEPVKDYLKHFETPEEFNLYYHQHKEEIDKQTTHILNKKFKISGYHITKIKGDLCLKKLRENEVEEQETDLQIRVENLEKKIKDICKQMNEIITYLNG